MHAKDQYLVSVSSEASKQEQETRGQEARYPCLLLLDTLIDPRCLGDPQPISIGAEGTLFPDTRVRGCGPELQVGFLKRSCSLNLLCLFQSLLSEHF